MTNDSTSKTLETKEKTKRRAPIKIVLRRLPREMAWDELQTQLDPLPATDFLQFVPANLDADKVSFPRAYFVFSNDEDMIEFRDRFNGYVFIDSKGSESVGLVELAPNPKVSRHKMEDALKRDRKCDTLDAELEYKKFLDDLKHPYHGEVLSLEQLIKEIELRNKTVHDRAVQDTPLTQFMIRKNEDKFRRILEKRRNREEERRARLQRLHDKEYKSRPETRKVTEFRNSKFERFERAALKERSNDRDGERRERERGERCVGGGSRKDGAEEHATQKPERLYKSERFTRKERDEASGDKEKVVRSERLVKRTEQIERKKKTEEGSVAAKEDKEKERDTEKAEVKMVRIVRAKPTVVVQTAATSQDNGDSTDKAIAESSKQTRRAKDRPERAIYQPGAMRRRALEAAKAAVVSETAGKTTTDTEVP